MSPALYIAKRDLLAAGLDHLGGRPAGLRRQTEQGVADEVRHAVDGGVLQVVLHERLHHGLEVGPRVGLALDVDGVPEPLPQSVDHLQRHGPVARGVAFLVAHVDVHPAGPGLDRLDALFDDLFRRVGLIGVLVPLDERPHRRHRDAHLLRDVPFVVVGHVHDGVLGKGDEHVGRHVFVL